MAQSLCTKNQMGLTRSLQALEHIHPLAELRIPFEPLRVGCHERVAQHRAEDLALSFGFEQSIDGKRRVRRRLPFGQGSQLLLGSRFHQRKVGDSFQHCDEYYLVGGCSGYRCFRSCR